MVPKKQVIANGTILRVNFIFRQWSDFDVLPSPYIKVSDTFTITEKTTPDTSSLRMSSLKRKAVEKLFRLLNTILNFYLI